jgi:hypothetical protein
MQCSAVPCGAVQWLFYHSMCFRLLPATIAAVALHVLLLLLLSSLLSSLFSLAIFSYGIDGCEGNPLHKRPISAWLYGLNVILAILVPTLDPTKHSARQQQHATTSLAIWPNQQVHRHPHTMS